MGDKTIVAGVLMDETITLSFVEVCQTCDISEEILLEMLEHGLFREQARPVRKTEFEANTLRRIQSACRLQADLGINVPGVVLVLELLDELEQARNELSILQRHVQGEY